MSESDPCTTSEGLSASGRDHSESISVSSHGSIPSMPSLVSAILPPQIGSTVSTSSLSRTTSSGASSDDSMSSRGLTLYEANLARQLLALKEGVPSDIITPRRQRQFIDDTRKDAAYWERRRKNNEAAKRSREKRRINDLAMESQISKVQQDMDQLRNELMSIKRYYGLKVDEPFMPPASDALVPTTVTPSLSSPHIRPPPPCAHLSMVIKPFEPRAHPSTLLRPMLHMTHPHVQVLMKPVPQTPPNSTVISPSVEEGSTIPQAVDASDAIAELAPMEEGKDTEMAEHRPKDDTYCGAETPTQNQLRSSTKDEQAVPLNLVVKSEKQNKETSEELYIRMHKEVAKRYEEIKAGSVDHSAEANRDSGVVSPGGSTSSTSSGSPYSKRLRVDESDSVMEAESISTGSENTSSETQSPNRAVMDAKYVERRKRNNEASRRSRENRKHIAKTREEKTDVLELENNKLRQELNSLASEVSNLKQMFVAKHGKTTENEGSTQALDKAENESKLISEAS